MIAGILNKITNSSPMAQETFKWAMHIAENRRNALDNSQRSAVLAVQWNLAQQIVFSQIKAVGLGEGWSACLDAELILTL